MMPLFGPMPGGMELAVILLVAVLLFGANKIPKLARSTGEAMGEFKKGREEVEQELQDMQSSDTTTSDTTTSDVSDPEREGDAEREHDVESESEFRFEGEPANPQEREPAQPPEREVK